MPTMVRAGVIGVGRMAGRHVEALRSLSGVDVVACCGRRPQPTSVFAREHQIPRAFTDYRALLAEVPLDLVTVATTAPAHAEVTIAAAEAGVRHILCEKPMAPSVTEADRMVTACQRAGARLCINHSRRWSAAYRWLSAVLASGRLGSVRHVHYACGGGRLGSNGGHAFDLVRFLTGSEAVQVCGGLDGRAEPDPRGPEFVDPGGVAQVLMADGSRASVDLSGDLGVPMLLVLTCTDGRAWVDESAATVCLAGRAPEHRSKPAHARYSVPLEPETGEFRRGDLVEMTAGALSELLSDAPLSCAGEDGRAALEMAVAVHVSHREGGRPVGLPLTGADREMRLAAA